MATQKFTQRTPAAARQVEGAIVSTVQAIKRWAEFGLIATALDGAHMTDEPHNWSGDSDRLLRIASGLSERLVDKPMTADDAECEASDIAALVKASRRVPGDVSSPERDAFIAAALQPLTVLTNDPRCLETGAEPKPPARPLLDAKKPRREGNASVSSAANHIASNLRAAQALLERFEPWECSDDLSALHMVLNGIEKQATVLRDDDQHWGVVASQKVQS